MNEQNISDPSADRTKGKLVKNLNIFIYLILIIIVVSVGAYLFTSSGDKEVLDSTTKAEGCYEEVSNVKCPDGTLCMTNPASSFCECMGGKLKIVDNEDGQAGVCLIDGSEYDEWEYFRMMNPTLTE